MVHYVQTKNRMELETLQLVLKTRLQMSLKVAWNGRSCHCEAWNVFFYDGPKTVAFAVGVLIPMNCWGWCLAGSISTLLRSRHWHYMLLSVVAPRCPSDRWLAVHVTIRCSLEALASRFSCVDASRGRRRLVADLALSLTCLWLWRVQSILILFLLL